MASWLQLEGLGPAKTLDRYVGAPKEGHLVHYVVGLDDALGAGYVVRVTDLPPSLHGLATGKTSDTTFMARDGMLTKSQGNLEEASASAGTVETPKSASPTLNIQ